MDELYSDRDHCTYGGVVEDPSLLDGNSYFVYQKAFAVPKDQQFLQLFVRVFHARSDRLRVGPKVTDLPETVSCSAGHVATYQLWDEAKFKGVVQKDRYITYEGPRGGYGFHITAKGEKLCSTGRDDLFMHYGVRPVWSYQQFWLSVK
jgi:hypothetical protein